MIRDLLEQRTELDRKIAEEQHQAAMTAWEDAKTKAREAKENVGKMRQAFNQASNEWSNYELECQHVQISLEHHEAAKPKHDDLPTEAELEAWERKRHRLRRTLSGPMYTRRQNLASNRERARIDLINADAAFVQMAYAERNARAKALGENGLPPSELSRVVL